MDNLLLTTIAITLLYYFLVYKQKKTSPSSQLTYKHQATQTETPTEFPSTLNCPGELSAPEAIPNPQILKLERDIKQKERTIEGLNKSYERLETKRKGEHETSTKQISSLQQQLNSLKSQLNQLTSEKKTENKDLETTLDTLIKAVNEINLQLD
jgi:hypothetical protein